MKAYEELEMKEIYKCKECHCNVGDDWEYKDFSNKQVVECPQCGTCVYLEDCKTEQEKIEEIEDLVIEEISDQIAQGMTSGILDNENGIRTSWKLEVNHFEN